MQDAVHNLLTSATRRSPILRGFHAKCVQVSGRSVFIGCLMTGRLYGQGGATGAIIGVVVDTTGASVADAEVQITDSRTEALARKLAASSDGSFTAALLPPARITSS